MKPVLEDTYYSRTVGEAWTIDRTRPDGLVDVRCVHGPRTGDELACIDPDGGLKGLELLCTNTWAVGDTTEYDEEVLALRRRHDGELLLIFAHHTALAHNRRQVVSGDPLKRALDCATTAHEPAPTKEEVLADSKKKFKERFASGEVRLPDPLENPIFRPVFFSTKPGPDFQKDIAGGFQKAYNSVSQGFAAEKTREAFEDFVRPHPLDLPRGLTPGDVQQHLAEAFASAVEIDFDPKTDPAPIFIATAPGFDFAVTYTSKGWGASVEILNTSVDIEAVDTLDELVGAVWGWLTDHGFARPDLVEPADPEPTEPQNTRYIGTGDLGGPGTGGHR